MQGSTKGITYKARTVTPALGTLTTKEIAAYVRNLSAGQAQAILDGWAEGNGTLYQKDLALTGRKYGQGGPEKGHNPPKGAEYAESITSPELYIGFTNSGQ